MFVELSEIKNNQKKTKNCIIRYIEKYFISYYLVNLNKKFANFVPLIIYLYHLDMFLDCEFCVIL